MAKSKWSYGTVNEDPTLQDKIIDLLVEAKIPDRYIDTIMEAILAAEAEMQKAK